MKIGFILLSNPAHPLASTRIAVLNMLPLLRDAGWDADIVFHPAQHTERPDLSTLDAEQLRAYDLVAFQKVHGPHAQALAQRLHALGVPTAYMVCDLVRPDMAAACSITIVISNFLKSLYPPELQERIYVVHDGIEDPGMCSEQRHGHRGSLLRPLRAVLITSLAMDRLPQIGTPPAWLAVDIVGGYPPAAQRWQRCRKALRHLRIAPGWRARWQVLYAYCHPRLRRVAWSPQAVADAVRRSDFAILPIDTSAAGKNGLPPVWMMKSANRLTLKMASGLPVLATPIPAYEEVLEDGRNGLFARTGQEWRTQLEALRDPALRARLGSAARSSVLTGYSAQAQASALMAVLQQAVSRS